MKFQPYAQRKRFLSWGRLLKTGICLYLPNTAGRQFCKMLVPRLIEQDCVIISKTCLFAAAMGR